MKKVIYSLILFIFLLPNAINAGEIHGNCSFGYIPEADSFCTDLCIRYCFWIISLGGGIETLMEKSSDSVLFFNPYRNVYYFGAEIKPCKHLCVEAKHSCTHAIWSYEKQFYDKFESGKRTTISVGIKW